VAVLEVLLVLGPIRFVSDHPARFGESMAANLPAEGRPAVVNNGAFYGNYGPVLMSVQPGGYTSLFSIEYQELLSGARSAGVVLEGNADNTRFLFLLGYDRSYNPETNTISIFEPKPNRAWVARCAEPGAAAEVRAADFPLFTCVTTDDGNYGSRSTAPGAAKIVSERPGAMKLTAQGPGYLFTGIPLYPGWSATVDGKSADVEALDGAIAGVFLEDGEHEVSLSYLPGGFKLGLLLTVLSGAVLAGIFWWERRSDRTAPAEPDA
jgi:hypothetical protein